MLYFQTNSRTIAITLAKWHTGNQLSFKWYSSFEPGDCSRLIKKCQIIDWTLPYAPERWPCNHRSREELKMEGFRCLVWSQGIKPLRVHRIVHKFHALHGHSGEVVNASARQAEGQRFESSLRPKFSVKQFWIKNLKWEKSPLKNLYNIEDV